MNSPGCGIFSRPKISTLDYDEPDVKSQVATDIVTETWGTAGALKILNLFPLPQDLPAHVLDFAPDEV